MIPSMLTELGFPPDSLTAVYEDNASIIMMIVNIWVLTEITRHISICFFAIQDWKENGEIELIHIPDVINTVNDVTELIGWVLHS